MGGVFYDTIKLSNYLTLMFLYYLFIFFIGISFGSFLNAWVYRTRENVKITQGRSMCPHCRRRLKWHENIPLFSFFFLKGRCYVCKNNISWEYPMVEFIMGLLFVLAAAINHHKLFTLSPELVRDWIIIFVLAFVFLYDLKFREILDAATIPTAIVLFLFSMAMGWHSWQSMTLGVVVAAGFFLLQYVVSKGRWIGGGDIRLGLLMGVILGWPVILVGLMIAYVVGAITSMMLVALQKRELSGETPFGTYLAFGTVVAMFWGQQIVNWYLLLLK